MKNKLKTYLISLCLISFFMISCESLNKEVSLTSLLNEMTSEKLLSEFPSPQFTCQQFSSYDRNSKGPGLEGWFANHDASWFIRTDEIAGRREFVMFDADGPGVIVRFWMTFGNEAAYTGTLRVYFDGSDTPEIEGPVLEIISGGKLVGEPLSSSVSPESNYFHRGHNLYLPLPYAVSCKVTYECPELNPERHSPSVYYNINYRTYTTNTQVTTFSIEQLTNATDQVQALQESLKDGLVSVPQNSHTTNITGQLQPGENLNSEISGREALYQLSFQLAADNLPQALRSTVVSIKFDDIETVWSPLGDFFGTGYKTTPYQTWHTRVSAEGVMSCYWTMPYKKSAEITISNMGDQPVDIIQGEVIAGSYKWTQNTMYFGARWHEYNAIQTAGAKGVGGTDQHIDINFANLVGAGVYAGDAITIFNTADAWWGEGDEKVYVDGETFPSHIGTGTEDYIGYAWCRPEAFSHFLIAQPDGSGNFHTGMTVNMRHRMLDGIPFKESIKFDMELWHWAPTIMNYAIVSYWYMKPGGLNNTRFEAETVKEKVMFTLSDFVDPVPDDQGVLEGENLRVMSVSAGSYQVQQSTIWNWSKNRQLWWMDGGESGTLVAEFEISTPGRYSLDMVFTKAIDYGNFMIRINEGKYSANLVGYHDQKGQDVITESVKLGTLELLQGINTLEIKLTGRHSSAQPSYMVGIDCLKLKLLN